MVFTPLRTLPAGCPWSPRRSVGAPESPESSSLPCGCRLQAVRGRPATQSEHRSLQDCLHSMDPACRLSVVGPPPLSRSTGVSRIVFTVASSSQASWSSTARPSAVSVTVMRVQGRADASSVRRVPPTVSMHACGARSMPRDSAAPSGSDRAILKTEERSPMMTGTR